MDILWKGNRIGKNKWKKEVKIKLQVSKKDDNKLFNEYDSET